jgi:hypothetical protein
MASMGSNDLNVSPGTIRLCRLRTDCLKDQDKNVRHCLYLSLCNAYAFLNKKINHSLITVTYVWPELGM